MAGIAEISSQSFEKEVLKNQLPVLVDFWASWCGPCRTLGPILEEVSKNYQGKLIFFKVNVDNNEDLSIEYQIKSIPTLLIFKQGKIVATNLGAISRSKLEEFIEQNL